MFGLRIVRKSDRIEEISKWSSVVSEKQRTIEALEDALNCLRNPKNEPTYNPQIECTGCENLIDIKKPRISIEGHLSSEVRYFCRKNNRCEGYTPDVKSAVESDDGRRENG